MSVSNSSSGNSSEANGDNSSNIGSTLPPIITTLSGHDGAVEGGGGDKDSSSAFWLFSFFLCVFIVIIGLGVYYLHRKKKERLRMAFKPIYNTEGEDDWDVDVKDTRQLTPTRAPPSHLGVGGPGPGAGRSPMAMDAPSPSLASPSDTTIMNGSSNFNKIPLSTSSKNSKAQLASSNGAMLQFNLNADTEEIPHPESTYAQPPITKFTPT